jgi:hypothetical protein
MRRFFIWLQVQTAKVILSSPELRRKYEAGGMEALDEAALHEHGLQVRFAASSGLNCIKHIRTVLTCALCRHAHQPRMLVSIALMQKSLM